MVQYEKIREMPISELLAYFECLEKICNCYANELRPLFNSQNPKEQLRWREINNEYQHAKMYYDVVLNAMKYKTYNNLDNYSTPSEELKQKNKPVIKKKPVKTTTRVKKTAKK